MNILFCYPWLDLGGAPNTAITLARGLRERGHEVFFFTKGGGIYESRAREAGIAIISAPYDPVFPRMYHLYPRAGRIFKEALERHGIDIVHAFHPNSYSLALFIAPWKSIPVLFTAVWYPGWKPFPAYPGRVIFVAEEFRDEAAPLFAKHARDIIVLPNRIDLDMFRPGIESGEFSSRRRLPTKGWKISFMSRIDRTKLQSLLNASEAARILADRGREVTLAIAGDGMCVGELSAAVGDINERAGREIVVLLGPILETPQFLSWPDIVLGIGRCAWEGMACGKPTIVVGETGFAGVAEPARVRELGYYNFSGRNERNVRAPEELADAVERIMSDERLYAELGAFARSYVREHYDYREGAKRLEQLYRESLADPPLTAGQKARLALSNVVHGYGQRLYASFETQVRISLGRCRAEDFMGG